MSTEVKRRRGTALEHETFTGANAEITVNSTNNSLHVHDAVTVGGHEISNNTTNNGKFKNDNHISNPQCKQLNPDVVPPSATPTDYVPGEEVYSGAFADEAIGIEGLTDIGGLKNATNGKLYFLVPNTGAIADLSTFTASYAGLDLKPKTDGITFSLDGSNYKIEVDFSVASDVFSVKFETGSVATGHEAWMAKGIDYTFDTVASMVSIGAPVGSKVSTFGYYSLGDGGGGEYVITNGFTGDGFIDHNTASGTAIFTNRNSITLRQAGAISDATLVSDVFSGSDNLAAINNVINKYNSIIVDGKFYADGVIELTTDKLTIKGTNKWTNWIVCDEFRITDQFFNNAFFSDFSMFGLVGCGVNFANTTASQAAYTGSIERMHIYGEIGSVLCERQDPSKLDNFYEFTFTDVTLSYTSGGGILNARSTRSVFNRTTNYPSNSKYYGSGNAPIFLNPNCKLRDCNMGYNEVDYYILFDNAVGATNYNNSSLFLENCNLESARLVAIKARNNARVSLSIRQTDLVDYGPAQPTATGFIDIETPLNSLLWDTTRINAPAGLQTPKDEWIKLNIVDTSEVVVLTGASAFGAPLRVTNTATGQVEEYNIAKNKYCGTASSGSLQRTSISKDYLDYETVPVEGIPIATFYGADCSFTADLFVSSTFAVGVVSAQLSVAGLRNGSDDGFNTAPSVVLTGAQASDFSGRHLVFSIVDNGTSWSLVAFIEQAGSPVNKSGVYLKISGDIVVLNANASRYAEVN